MLYFSKPKANRVGYSYAHFAYEGTATFQITCLKGNVEAVDASPHNYNMVIDINENKIVFNLAQKKSRYKVFDIRTKGETYQLIIAADPNLNLSAPKVNGTKVINAKIGMKDVSGGLNSSNDAKSGKSNTEKIQKILKKLSENGGGTLYFPEGVYPFTTINAESNVSIYLDGGAILRGSGIRTDYNWATTGANGIQIKERDIRIKNAKNFKILGKGMIDANSIVVCQKGRTSSGSRELNNDPQLIIGILMDGMIIGRELLLEIMQMELNLKESLLKIQLDGLLTLEKVKILLWIRSKCWMIILLFIVMEMI